MKKRGFDLQKEKKKHVKKGDRGELALFEDFSFSRSLALFSFRDDSLVS